MCKIFSSVTSLVAIAIFIAFASVGALIGWLTGASETPVVATVLPLLFALVGAAAVNLADRHFRDAQLLAAVAKLGIEDSRRASIVAELKLHDAARWLPGFWALGVCIFCIECRFLKP